MSPDPALALALRLDTRRRLFPAGVVCGCGEWHSVVFVAGTRPLRCYECDRERRGLPRTEAHHLGGRPSPLTVVQIPANLHRVLSDLQDAAWRDRAAPGSVEAVTFDLAALVVVGIGWRRAGDSR